ncbi:PSD1 and planctomycete cytochrome C domain-containing protein [Planctomicrobium sp. SH661]|uniref:PSD1 and planctomycete cytochrome C domain-containing protein n=1 Tax=Planctomicrobium sp. SH661 TaxID=3448124 RepID=UPI003F5B0532
MTFRQLTTCVFQTVRLTAVALLCMVTNTASAAETKSPELVHDVLPLLKVHCVRCHGPAVQEGKLNLALPPGIKRGGESGAVVVAGSPEKSLLWELVESDKMPADEPMSAEDKLVLKKWIEAGAPGLPESVTSEPNGDEHWAFQRLASVAIPTVTNSSRVRTPVDYFIEQQLERLGLTLGPEASRETLIRRVSFDLTGLPPTLEEIDRFVNDSATDAYEQMVDRYLNSQHYGERWGKYWLDTAGYADSNGYFGRDSDRPLAYRYRDYVIRSINADKPWNQFLREQLAGDEIVQYTAGGDVQPEMVELLEAVHFLRNSPDGTDASDGNPDEVRADKYAVLEGTAQILGSALLGVTVQCARCHDHKFEPFTQKDYYQLQAILYPAFNLEQWITPEKRVISTATRAEQDAWKEVHRQLDERIAAVQQEFLTWSREHRILGTVVFADTFDSPTQKLSETWTGINSKVAGSSGLPPVNIDSPQAPGLQIANGQLNIIEGNHGGSIGVSTQTHFDWTPNDEKGWIQVTFDLVSGGATAPYVGYYIALKAPGAEAENVNGNILIDGAAAGQATIHANYPGDSVEMRGKIGKSGYNPGHNFGVRITNVGGGKYEVAQVVDGLLEENRVTLQEADLPDGGFGFEFCCGRSFVVDNLLVESSNSSAEATAQEQELAKEREERQAKTEAAVKALEAERPKPLQQLAVVNNVVPQPPEVHLLVRGSYQSPGEVVAPAAPSVLRESSESTASSFPAGSTRTGLAEWLVTPDSRASALLARVTVNRWWHHHFGTGLVATPDNLGYSGAPPSHPELIEYLAGQLIAENWSAKAIHRLILRSSVYRQSSIESEQARLADPQNRWLSRYPMRRLDAESLRDALLAVPGELDPQMYGPYVATKRADDGDVIVPEENSHGRRRSVYLQQRRTQVVGMLEAFDAPSIVFNCTARSSTTVPLQSLKLLNSEFMRRRAEGLSKRVRSMVDSDDAAIDLAFRLAFARHPSREELAACKSFLQGQAAEYPQAENAQDLAWIDFSQMLLASNSFLYIE